MGHFGSNLVNLGQLASTWVNLGKPRFGLVWSGPVRSRLVNQGQFSCGWLFYIEQFRTLKAITMDWMDIFQTSFSAQSTWLC